MELTLALDAGAGPVVAADAKAPGTDPNDAASVAFASLLASLVAATAPTPDLTVPAVPDAATEVAPVAAGAAAAVPTLVFGAPIALPAAPAPEPEPEPEPAVDLAPEEAEPAARTAEPELAPTLFALPEPTARAVEPPAIEPRADEADLELEADVDPQAEVTAAPAPRHRPAEPVRPMAVQLPAAAAAVVSSTAQPAAAAVEAEASAADRPGADPVALTHPSAYAPAAPVREILKPEIVAGPGAARPASPVEQIVKAVAPLRRLADGTHTIVLELHPAELGAVRVELSLDRGIVHLGLRADAEGTGQLLRAALPELRSQLDAAGLTSGRVSVDAGQAGPRGEGQQAWRTGPDRDRRRPLADDAELVEELVPSAYSTSDYGHVDVRL